MIKTLLTTSLLISTIFFLSGCTANLTEPEIDFEPPVYVEQMPPMEDKQDFAATGSIFGQGDNPLFSDHKAMHVNDIVRVVISETATSSNVAAKSLSENDSLNLGAGTFTSAIPGDLTSSSKLNSKINSLESKVKALSDIGFSAGSTSGFTGSGSATKDASFTTTISARIVKVLRNGNYFISGKREILIDEQKQIVQISGVIRPYDIDQYNKIDSEKVSDAKILYKTQGDVERATERGWGSKIVQSVWPF